MYVLVISCNSFLLLFVAFVLFFALVFRVRFHTNIIILTIGVNLLKMLVGSDYGDRVFPSPSLPHPLTFPPLLSLFSLPLPPLSLEVGPQIQLGGLGERSKLPSGVWGGAPAEIEFGAF